MRWVIDWSTPIPILVRYCAGVSIATLFLPLMKSKVLQKALVLCSLDVLEIGWAFDFEASYKEIKTQNLSFNPCSEHALAFAKHNSISTPRMEDFIVCKCQNQNKRAIFVI